MPQKQIEMKPQDLKRVIEFPEEATPEQLLAAKAILTVQIENAKGMLKTVDNIVLNAPKGALQKALDGNDELLVNGRVRVIPSGHDEEKLVYDQKAMNAKGNETLSAPFRSARNPIDPKLVRAAIKAGTFPADFAGSTPTVWVNDIIIDDGGTNNG